MGKKAAQSDVKDGDVVLVKQGLGIVRFRGRVPTKKGVQVGIELVGDGMGDTDGSVNDRHFFKCKPGMGIFLPHKKVKKKITPAALLKKIERLNTGVVELKLKFVELEDAHHMLQDDYQNRILAMSDAGSQYTDFDRESSVSEENSMPPPFSDSNGHTVVSEPAENSSDDTPRKSQSSLPSEGVEKKKKKKRVQFNSGVFDGHEKKSDDKWSRTALSASLFDDLFDDDDAGWDDETEEDVSAYEDEEDYSDDVTGGMEIADSIPDVPEAPNRDSHVLAMKNTFINDLNFSMDIDVREAEIEEQRLQLQKRLKLLGVALMKNVKESDMTQNSVTSHVEEWVKTMGEREKELTERAATYKLRERKQMEKEKRYIKEKKEIEKSRDELNKIQTKIDTGRKILNELREKRKKWEESMAKCQTDYELFREEIQQKLSQENTKSKKSVKEFEKRMRETVLAQKAEVEDLQTKLNEQEGALASREKLLQQRLNKMDERKKEMDTSEVHLKGNIQDLQEQQEFFAEQCRELDRKTSAFESKESNFISDKEQYEEDRKELDAEIARYHSNHKELSKNQHLMMEKLKVLTERELSLETKEEAVDQREFEVKGEYKACLREQKRLKKIKKEASEEQEKLKQLSEKINREQKKLNGDRQKLKNDQRDFSQVKKRHDDGIKKKQMEVRKEKARLKAKEKELEEEQSQLLLDSVGGDSYKQLVELRKQVVRLNADPGLQDEEKYEIQQRRQKLENDQKSLEQEKIIYEKFRMSDQQEIAALREDFERKLKHQEALQKELELAKMHAEEELDRAKFEQEQYQKQKEKHIVRTQDLEHDLKRLNIQFEDSLSLESRGEKIEEMRRQVANERQFMRQQNAKLKDSLDDISRREAQLQEKIRSIEKEKAELRAKNTRLEAKQMSIKNQEKEQKNRASRSQSKKVPGTLQPLKHLSDSWRVIYFFKHSHLPFLLPQYCF